jgi:hypothetical protein
MWTELYQGAAADLLEALNSGPVVLTGLPGSGRAEFVREILLADRVVELAALDAGTAAGLRQDAVRAAIDAIAGNAPGADVRRALASAFGARAADALAIAEGRKKGTLPFSEIFAAIPSQAAVIVHDAHLLEAPWAARSLWALRARVQQPNRPGLVLLTRPWDTDVLVGIDAPFFGFARLLSLPIPSVSDWARVTDYKIHPPELDWLLAQTRGLPRTTLAVLERLSPSEGEERTEAELEAAWKAQVRGSRDAALAVRRLVGGIHQLAPRLLRAIASGARVYSSVPEARTDAIAAALRAMRDHDVIYQPRARQWVVADPALVPHLASARAF